MTTTNHTSGSTRKRESPDNKGPSHPASTTHAVNHAKKANLEKDDAWQIASTRPALPIDIYRSEDEKLAKLAFAIAWRHLHDNKASEDVAADTMAAYKSRVKPPENPEAWITTVANNRTKNELRRRARAADLTARMMATRGPDVSSDDIEDLLVRLVLLDAVGSLPRRQKEAVTHCFLNGLDRKTAADRMGIGIETLKTHLNRGLVALREVFSVPKPGGREESK